MLGGYNSYCNIRSIKMRSRQLLIFLFMCVVFNMVTSHFIGLFVHLKQALNPDTFFNASITTLISGLFIAPVIEEVSFRGFLSTKRLYLFSLILLVFFISYAFGFNIIVIITVSILIITFLVIAFHEKDFTYTFNRYMNVLILFSCLTFCLTHIIVLEKYFLFPVAFISCIIIFFPSAYLFAKVRIAFGLRYSILLHSVHNILILAMNSLIYGSV